MNDNFCFITIEPSSDEIVSEVDEEVEQHEEELVEEGEVAKQVDQIKTLEG